MKRVLRMVGIFGGLFIGVVVLSNLWIVLQTQSSIYDEIDDLEGKKLALVLGTSKYSVGGGINPYFKNRMAAAMELYKAGKVTHILVSGDNRTKYYNEPRTMMEELVSLGIPEEDITLDYAGLRTLDSIVRCKEVFGQDDFIIVTQQFHNHRAVFISQHYGLDVIGYVADDVGSHGSMSVILREYLARPLALIDLYLLGTTPRYLGEKEDLNI